MREQCTGAMHTHILFYFREVCFQVRANAIATCRPSCGEFAFIVPIQLNPKNPICISPEFVVTQLMKNILGNQHKSSHADDQAQYVDDCECTVSQNVAPDRSEIIF